MPDLDFGRSRMPASRCPLARATTHIFNSIFTSWF